MQYTREHMPRCAEEVSAFVKDYFQTTKAGEGMDPLEFKWNLYEALDARGSILFITARDDDDDPNPDGSIKLAGFVSYFITEHMHHRQVLATCDMLAVHPSWRGVGVGRKLVELAEQWLKAQGVTHVCHGYRLIYGDDPLFPKLGYEAKETWYVKDIR